MKDPDVYQISSRPDTPTCISRPIQCPIRFHGHMEYCAAQLTLADVKAILLQDTREGRLSTFVGILRIKFFTLINLPKFRVVLDANYQVEFLLESEFSDIETEMIRNIPVSERTAMASQVCDGDSDDDVGSHDGSICENDGANDKSIDRIKAILDFYSDYDSDSD